MSVPQPDQLYALHVLAAALRAPERPMLFWRDGCVRGGELAQSLLDATVALARLGVDRTTTVAILMAGNRPEMLTARYAAHLLGAGVVHVRSMNPRTDAVAFSELTQTELLAVTGSTVLVVDQEHEEQGTRLRAARAGALVLATCGPGRSELASLARPRELDPLPASPRPTDRAIVGFTSGSTGRPAALAVSFRAWNRLVRLLAGDPAASSPMAAATAPAGGTPARVLAVTPISHAVAPMLDAALASGGSVVLHEGFDATAVLRCIEWLRVTETYLAVPHLYQLLEHPALPTTDVSSLRRLVYSGTPAAPHRVTRAAQVFGPALVQVYGASETGGISCLTAEDHLEPELLGTVGRPFPWVRLRIAEPDTGRELPRGEVGEVCVRSPTTMDGYVGDPHRTADVLRDGWVRTGDLGHVDRHGYLVLVGRRSQVIKSGGLKIYPASVEGALLRHPDVAEAVVYPWRDDDRVEHVHGAVRRRPGAACSTAQLREHVAAALSPAHAPSRLTFWDALPVTAQGKPDTQYLASVSGGAATDRLEGGHPCP